MNSSGPLFHIARIKSHGTGHMFKSPWDVKQTGGKPYDPELLYVECQLCGKPVIWESGKTTELLEAAEIDTTQLDETCMIISDGCPLCQPHETNSFTLAVVRVAGLTPDEALQLLQPGGTA